MDKVIISGWYLYYLHVKNFQCQKLIHNILCVDEIYKIWPIKDMQTLIDKVNLVF